MAYVVTEPCRNCKDTSCVEVCPTESFKDAGEMLVIDPETCVDCDACIPECPVDAIFHEENVLQKWQRYIQLNAELSETSPTISDRIVRE